LGITDHNVYPEIHVLAGHWPRAGLHELAVSKVAQSLDQGVELGDRVRLLRERGQRVDERVAAMAGDDDGDDRATG